MFMMPQNMAQQNNGYAPFQKIEIFTLTNGVKIFAAYNESEPNFIRFDILPDGTQWTGAILHDTIGHCKSD
jgi:hypothetical protein